MYSNMDRKIKTFLDFLEEGFQKGLLQWEDQKDGVSVLHYQGFRVTLDYGPSQSIISLWKEGFSEYCIIIPEDLANFLHNPKESPLILDSFINEVLLGGK